MSYCPECGRELESDGDDGGKCSNCKIVIEYDGWNEPPSYIVKEMTPKQKAQIHLRKEKCDNCGKQVLQVKTHFVQREEKWCKTCEEKDGEIDEPDEGPAPSVEIRRGLQ